MLRKPLGEGMKPTDSGKESSRQSARPVQGERGLGVWGRRPVRWPGCQKDLGFYSEMVLNTGIMGSISFMSSGRILKEGGTTYFDPFSILLPGIQVVGLIFSYEK